MLTPAYALTATERVLPRMALDFTTAALDPRVTVARSLDTATAVNSSGYIAVVNANLPRFDHDINGVCKGLLIEETRDNALTYSSDYSQAAWDKTTYALTMSLSGTLGPDNTTNTYAGIPTAVQTAHAISQNFAFVNAVTYTISIFAKPNGYNFIQITTGLTSDYINFNLSTGAVGNKTSFFTGTITPYKNGFYRCTATFTSNLSSTQPARFCVLSADSAARMPQFIGDTTSGVLFYGAQLETGAFATSYIPTTTTSLTRNADAVSMTGTNFSDWYNTTESTLFAEASTFSNVATDKFVANINNNGFPNRILMNFSATNNFAAAVVSNSVMQVIGTNGTATTLNTPIKMCFATKLNSFAFSQSGVAPTTSVSGAMPVTVDRLWIGGANTAAFLNGHMRQVKYWPQRLTNAEVQAFSK